MSRTGIECHCKRGGKLTVGWMERIGVFRTEQENSLQSMIWVGIGRAVTLQ